MLSHKRRIPLILAVSTPLPAVFLIDNANAYNESYCTSLSSTYIEAQRRFTLDLRDLICSISQEEDSSSDVDISSIDIVKNLIELED